MKRTKAERIDVKLAIATFLEDLGNGRSPIWADSGACSNIDKYMDVNKWEGLLCGYRLSAVRARLWSEFSGNRAYPIGTSKTAARHEYEDNRVSSGGLWRQPSRRRYCTFLAERLRLEVKGRNYSLTSPRIR